MLDVDEKPYTLDQHSPLKQIVAKGILAKPIGDIREAIFRLMTEDSLAFLEDKPASEIDSDFSYFQ